ncbi:hypothetical protein CPB84DRAFT_1853542 [Gymnopilus junonius]|uniref:RING-type domain-containing protein n=1 Tax=Gymnopilus junonius TaxID=109634 RepID=A0A9P5TFL0_GYMJU|nr:hypothetical protein CPB84DRAFT_1853542 [Gymnopilus junonius]
MGQSTSRYHEPSTRPTSLTPAPSTTTNAVAGASADPHSNQSVDADLSTSDSSGSRRSSLRKSIFKYMKPSRVRSRLGGALSDQSQEGGRSWRNSRRYSKAPLDSPTVPPDPHPTSSSNNLVDNSPDLLPSNKGKQREIGSPSDDDEDCTAASAAEADQALQLSDATIIPQQGSTSIVPISSGSYPREDTLVDNPALRNSPCHNISSSDEPDSSPPSEEPSPVYEWESVENASQSEPQAPTSPQQLNGPPARPFPPPGTLVVVQGIVHTTDVSRGGSSTSASPPSQENINHSDPLPSSGVELGSEQGRSRTRNRLSALLRPRSTSSHPHSISMNESMPTVVEAGLPDAESATVSPSVSQTLPGESSHNGNDLSNPSELSDTNNSGSPLSGDPSSSATENRPPSISSSSIDVLGTLLSVAAAATAASLLTGSSEPILSSGLAPPGSHPAVPSASNPLSSPTPTSTSLPHLPPYPPSPPRNAGLSDITAAGRAERMRQAWATIRERLGLRPSVATPENMDSSSQDNSANDPTASLQHGDVSTSGSTTDTRELMLAEMARAFNIGLGLNGLGGISPTPGAADDRDGANAVHNDSSDNHTASAESEGDNEERTEHTPRNASVTMPPEGSFERFLVDLQIDLRAALTQPSTTNVSGPTDNISSSSTMTQGGDQRQEIEVHNDDPYIEMPPLQEVSDSGSEFDEDDHEAEFVVDDEFRSADEGSINVASPSDSPSGSPNNTSQTPSQGSGRIDASGRINWWRLYRFPPVPSPRTGDRQLPNPPSQSAPAPSAPRSMSESVPPETAPGNQVDSSADHLDSESGPSLLPPPSAPSSSTQGQTSIRGTPLSQIPLHAVVPVIVVGLQSVNQEWRHDVPQPGADESLDFAGHPLAEDSANTSANENDELGSLAIDHQEGLNATQAGGNGLRGPGRARGWHSRAANAIRSLRSGRRNTETGSDAQTPLMAPGSRTFLIYVIGGYYPPDHSIVTGGPNILDSFEALLELADLLGQVKPPTVSKEDIEKSGLKIVKASELDHLEKQGQVASNCLDRCLICLDDYDAEDPIRIMSCRHAFHKGCVDEWLQTGRNNCPACRSTGVTTDSHSTSSMPTSAS